MRVLYWTQLFWPYIGGVEVLATRFLPAMRERGHEFIVVTSHGSLHLPDHAEYKGIPVHRFEFQAALAEGNLDQLMAARQAVARLKKRFKPDLIDINFTDPSVFFNLHTAEAHPAPVLVSIRLALPEQQPAGRPDTLLGQTLRSADWVTANSAAILADAHQLVPEIIPRSSVIYNGLDTPSVQPSPLPFEMPLLLCLGRVVEDKAFDLALKAFAALVDRFPQARLCIAGDGPARPALEQQAAELGVTDVVQFPGWIVPEEVPELINSATIIIMPSRWREAFGLVALQAAQMARPVVATRVGGLPEVVAHGQTGLLVENENVPALTEAIAFLLVNPEVAAEMGRAGRRRAQALFSWERHIDAYDDLYEKLILNH